MGVKRGLAYKGIDMGLGCTSAEENSPFSALLVLYCLGSKCYMGEHYIEE